MTNRKRDSSEKTRVRDRWLSVVGRRIRRSLNEFFWAASRKGHTCNRELLKELLIGLEYRDEVPTGLDFRGLTTEVGGVADIDLSGSDFRFGQIHLNFFRCDMSNCCFDASTLRGNFETPMRLSRFASADLKGVSFSRCQLEACCFDDAILDNASFLSANLAAASFRRAKCRGTDFMFANLVGANLREACLRGTPIQGAVVDRSTDVRGTKFIEIFDEERRDTTGRVFASAFDWRLALFDETTQYVPRGGTKK